MHPPTVHSLFVGFALSILYQGLRACLRMRSSIDETGTSTKNSLELSYSTLVKHYQESNLADNPFDSGFYKTPNGLSDSSEPGQTLKLEIVSNTSFSSNYAYPPGLTLFRTMYTSKNIFNKTVPATGYVLVPFWRDYQESGSPRTVVWAHGTSGNSRDCAPSADQGLLYNWQIVYFLATSGYIVIAPDYAGQGSDTEFYYMAGLSHAEDVVNMVQAVRQSLPFLEVGEWAVVGHSEGGMASWVTNQHQAEKPIGGFLGSVALAPSMDYATTMSKWFATPDSRKELHNTRFGTMYSLFLLASIHQIDPTVNLLDYLTPIGRRLYGLVTRAGCDSAAPIILEPFSPDDIYNDYSWANGTEAVAWANLVKNRGTGRLSKPMLIVQGDKDTDVPALDTIHAFDQHCAMFNSRSPITLHKYPGYDHEGINWAAYSDFHKYLDTLFHHDTLEDTCRSVAIRPFLTAANVDYNYAFFLKTSNPWS